MVIFKSPERPEWHELEGLTVFLGGSIEMGKAVDWQAEIARDFKAFDVTFFNPRRDKWDPTWEQKASNPKFSEQVNWEMDYLEEVDLALFFIQGDTKSPISIGEIYYLAAMVPDKLIVACEPDFWRRGNLEVLRQRKNFVLVSSLKELKEELLKVMNGRYPKLQAVS